MAKKQLKFKPTPAGILFLSAIAILLIAIIVLIIWAARSCGEKCKKSDDGKELPPIVNTDAPEETTEPTDAPIVGGWETPASTELTDALRAVFAKAIASRTDATYEPVSLLGTQLVSGTNYCFLAKKTDNTPDAQPTEVKVYVYEDLSGNASVTDVTDATNLSPEPKTPAPIDPNATTDPNATPGAITTQDPGSTPGSIVVNTPGQSTGTASPATTPAPTTTIYTSPSSSMKKNAQKGYVSKDKVKMRKGPGTNYDTVKTDIAKNTAVTLYVEQDGWWFLKCGDKYGYIRKDLVTKGTAPSTPTNSGGSTSSDATGKVIASKIALRKSASETSECIKEYEKDEALTVYYYTKDSSGRKWYYVKTSDGKKGYMFAEYVKITNGKVNSSD